VSELPILLAVKTKRGEALHVALGGFMGRTLCGARPAYRLPGLDSLIDAAGVQHPLRCTKCSREVGRLLAGTPVARTLARPAR
jgi:hypothetical protein